MFLLNGFKMFRKDTKKIRHSKEFFLLFPQKIYRIVQSNILAARHSHLGY